MDSASQAICFSASLITLMFICQPANFCAICRFCQQPFSGWIWGRYSLIARPVPGLCRTCCNYMQLILVLMWESFVKTFVTFDPLNMVFFNILLSYFFLTLSWSNKSNVLHSPSTLCLCCCLFNVTLNFIRRGITFISFNSVLIASPQISLFCLWTTL